MRNLKIKNLGPIGDADITFGDLTFLVGPQATGKSLALETLKLALDKDAIVSNLVKNGFIIGRGSIERVLNIFYGSGLSKMWKSETEVILDENPFKKIVSKDETDLKEKETLFYIPAQRVLSVSDGLGRPFMAYNNDMPYVNRAFGEVIRQFIQYGIGKQTTLFPMRSRLKGNIKKRLDDSIFHGASIELEEVDMQRRMIMNVDELKISIMSWSAGQKEYMPLLLGIYCLSGPPSKVLEKDEYKYVVIEEPEMGLHPQAIVDVILQIIELMQNGYQVIVSTHSTVFLDFAWAFNRLKKMDNVTGKYNALYELFHVEKGSRMQELLMGIFEKTINVYYMGQEGSTGKTKSRNITELNVWSDDPIMEEWGGLASFASRATEIVSQYTAI